MKCLLVMGGVVLTVAALLAFGGCGDDDNSSSGPRREAFGVDTLLTGLEYPYGLWIRGDRVYFTETRGLSTSYSDGAVRLRVFKLASQTDSLLVDHPSCFQSVVVKSDNKIYLASYVGSVPGEHGHMSVVNPTTLVETPVVDLEIAVKDMFLESDSDILIIGSSYVPTAKSLYRLPPPLHTSADVVKTGLGRTRCVTAVGSDIYFSDYTAIRKLSGSTVEEWYSKSVQSLSASSKYMFYADYSGGKIGMIDFATKTDSTLVSGLHGPLAVRWVEQTSRLYFTESGSSAAEYTDGTLQVIKGIR